MYNMNNILAFYDGDSFSCMNLVRGDGVAVEVPDGLDLVGLPIQLYLVGLHHLLHNVGKIGTYFTKQVFRCKYCIRIRGMPENTRMLKLDCTNV